ncbi:MAG: RNA polymerase sporulation sigma factor SigK [Erysipelotrichaceae bacterium]|nr:RNA polymerase sporulation sigma factor SigK [Erysipelotrichaceae bacterium]
MFILTLLQQLFFVSYIKTQAFKPPLSKTQEQELLSAYESGDQKARSKLIEHNLRLVAHIAKKYENNKDLTEDLISIGTIGLIKAVDSYKPGKSTKLSTYAAKCIENEILMHLRAGKKTNLDVSLNETISIDNDGSEMSLIDIIPSNEKPFIDTITTNDSLNLLQVYFKILSPREQTVLIQRYGLNNQKIKTQKEIAKELHISRSYVSRIEKRALIKLLKAYLNQ